MAGTVSGGTNAGITNKALYGEDYYSRIGRLGGRASTTGGFYANRELARQAGAIGGRLSKRGKASYCYQGHRLDKANTMIVGKRKSRYCRLCREAYQERYKERRRELRELASSNGQV